MSRVEIQQVMDEAQKAQEIVNAFARGGIRTEQRLRGLLNGPVSAVCGKIREVIATHADPVIESWQRQGWQDRSTTLCLRLVDDSRRLNAAVGRAMHARPLSRDLTPALAAVAHALAAVIGAMKDVADDRARKRVAG